MRGTQAILAGLLVISIAVTGCKKDDNNPTTPTPTATKPSAPRPTNFGSGISPVNAIVIVRTSTFVEPIPGYPVGTDVNVGAAAFGSPGQDKGTVSVTAAGTAYSFAKTVASGSTSYIHPDPANPTSLISISGSATNVSFAVQSYAFNPSTSNNVTVPGQLRMTAPAASASVPRTSALTVTWSLPNGGAGSQNAIFIADAAGHSVFKENLGNVTSAQFTAAEMGGLQAGTAFVYALTYNYRLTNSNETVLIGEAAALNQITLQ